LIKTIKEKQFSKILIPIDGSDQSMKAADDDVRNKEIELKNTPGVIEVGLFTKHASVYYKANDNGSFETVRS
jgi:ribose 5-phosphate isomerase